MIHALLLKNLIPFLMGITIATASILGVIHYTQKSINVSCPPPEVNVSCPKCECPGNSFEVEKMKGFKGNFTLHQHFEIEANGDSLMMKKIITEMTLQLEMLRVVKCK